MTRTGIFVETATIKRMAPFFTQTMGLDAFINQMLDAKGPPPPWSWNRAQQAEVLRLGGYDARMDLNGDGRVNPGDQALAANIGVPVASPPPSGDWLSELIKSVDGTPHEHLVPGTAPGWDWYAHGVIQGDPNGRPSTSAWASFQEITPGAAGGLCIEVRNFQQWALTPGGWQNLHVSIRGSQVHPIPPHEGGVIGDMGTGPILCKPRGTGSQFWSYQSALPLNAIGVITMYEVRAEQPSQLLVNAGGDYWPSVGAPSGNGGAMVGRYIIPTTDWRKVAASGVNEALLRQYGSPI